jgi:signal transduction histidine kinase
MAMQMRVFASEIFEADEIDFKFTIAPDLENFLLPMNLRKELYLIYKEAINNIAKYARCSSVRVNLYLKGKSLIMEICDNGIGFNVSEQIAGTGNGLKNMKHRAESVHGIVTIKSAVGKGTSLNLQIPVVT